MMLTLPYKYKEDTPSALRARRKSLRLFGLGSLQVFFNPIKLSTSLGLLGAGLIPGLASADEQAFKSLFNEITAGAVPREGGIVIETPRLADNGHSAAFRVHVESPMSADDYVKSIFILSDRNPRPFIARFDLTRLNPKAEISTRVRLNGSQNVHVLALCSNGEWLTAHVPVEVTESACLDAS
jgi:sulfur-oxidizing protein SoxY